MNIWHNHVILMHRCSVITTNEDLIERIEKGTSFTAVFDKHNGDVPVPQVRLDFTWKV